MEIMETPYPIGDNDSRLALTFLDFLDKEHAINDELMVDKNTGKIYYKKEDGSIVPSTESISTTTLNMLEFSSAINRNDSEFIYPTTNNSTMVMLEHKMPTNESIISKPALLGTFTFKMNKASNGFFINLKSRRNDNNIIETLLFLYNSKYPNNTTLTNITLDFSVKYVSSTGAEVIKTKQEQLKLNLNKLIIIDAANTITELSDVAYIEIVLNSVVSPLITEMIVDPSYTALDISKTGDGNIEIESFDISAFMDKIDSIPTDSNTTIVNIYNASTVADGVKDIGGDTKKLDERFIFIEGLTPKVVEKVEDLPHGDTIPSISLLIEEVVEEAGDI